MTTSPADESTSPKRRRRGPGRLPPPPAGAAVLTREQAAAFVGLSLGAFADWEKAADFNVPRYRIRVPGAFPIVYVAADLPALKARVEQRSREQAAALEPSPDPERPGVYRVPISSRLHAAHALIDAEDLPKVAGKRWNMRVDPRTGRTEVILASVTQRVVPLKRVIMGVDAPGHARQMVVHVNGDVLDCRRSNLRLTTAKEQAGRTSKIAARAGRPVSSKYKGVVWDTRRRCWKAQFSTHGANRVLGRFRDQAQAAAAYDQAARAYFGDGATLNFPDGVVPAPTFLGPDGTPVRERNRYRVPRNVPPPPPGVTVVDRAQAAEMLGISASTFMGWELDRAGRAKDGSVKVTRYRVLDRTGSKMLYDAAEIRALRDKLDAVGAPYPDPHPDRAGVWRVPLRTLDGYVEALVDEADLPIVRSTTWNLVAPKKAEKGLGAVVSVGARDEHRVQLKRLIMGLQDAGPTVRVAHVNGNPLDCRRCNLTLSGPDVVTRRVFKILHRRGRPTSSRFKGVCWSRQYQAWQSQIRIGDVNRKLGYFDAEIDAALTYDEAAREAWGPMARVNFPLPGELPSAASPVAPADLNCDGHGPRPPARPVDLRAQRESDGSLSLSWTGPESAAGAGVKFAVLRKLPGQKRFVRIATVEGSTCASGRAGFVDSTLPTAQGAEGSGAATAEYAVYGLRSGRPGETSATLTVDLSAAAPAAVLTTLGPAAGAHARAA